MLVRKITGFAIDVPNIGPVALTHDEAQQLVAQLDAAGLLPKPTPVALPPQDTVELLRLRRALLRSRHEVAELRAMRKRRAA